MGGVGTRRLNNDVGRFGPPDGKAAAAHQELERITQRRHADHFDRRARHQTELHQAAPEGPAAPHPGDPDLLSPYSSGEHHHIPTLTEVRMIFNFMC